MSNQNLIAQYETAEEVVKIHGLKGGFTVFVGARMVQRDLNIREVVCYLAHALQAAHYKLSKHAPEVEPSLYNASVEMSDALHAFESYGGTITAAMDDAWEKLSLAIEHARSSLQPQRVQKGEK